MKPTSIPMLVLLAFLAAVFGNTVSGLFASFGQAVPAPGWMTTVIFLVVAVLLFIVGLPMRRYMQECEERKQHPTSQPRKHNLDLITAWRTVVFAQAAAYTGVLVGGFFIGEAVYFAMRSGMPPALWPCLGAGVAGLVLATVGVIVERWGKLPPQDGPEGQQHTAEA
ncbi:DUF3180 domain-containing protein [Devriesea agamarum]|uniref:DUF3180 domain-containing protein n=1 Tax=Devriesea agamarum TaxID=472569 RepID=UPI00071C7FB1|nr:DUF3180 domain-containing protein [Devriesea agamarum]